MFVLIVDEGIVGRLAEMDIVVADLARSNLRIAEVERRNGELRTEIAALQSGKGTGAEERANKLELAFRTLELEYDTVAQKLEHHQEERKTEKEMIEKRVKSLERDVARRQEEADGLKMKLRSLDDYDEIKRELEILKVISYEGVPLIVSTLNFLLSMMTIRIKMIQFHLLRKVQLLAVHLKLSSCPAIRNFQMTSQFSEYHPQMMCLITGRSFRS
jgi:hypothetical protein